MASAAFTIEAATSPVEVAEGATVDLALTSTTGVRTVAWSIVGGSDSTKTAPTITPAGSPAGATATFTFNTPVGAVGLSWIVKCVINNGVDAEGQAVAAYTATGIVGVVNSGGYLPLAFGENLERNATHGITDDVNAQLNASAAMTEWTAYTPGFSAAGGSPSLGNGTASGMWRQVGDSIEFTALYLFGTTTNYGTGALQFDVFGDGPIGSIDDSKILVGSAGMAGQTFLQDSSVPLVVPVYPQYVSGSTVKLITVDVADVEGTVPFTFANGDSIYISGTAPILAGG